jgi:hypothetical protein
MPPSTLVADRHEIGFGLLIAADRCALDGERNPPTPLA